MKNIFKKAVKNICLHLYWGVSKDGNFYVCESCGKKKERDIEKEMQEIYKR